MAHGGRAAPTARKARRAAVQRRARDMAIASCSTAVSVCGSRSARISGPGTALRGDAVGSRLAQIGDAVQLPHMGYVFRLQQRRQLTALAGSQRLEPFERISPKWIVIPDAFAAEQVRYPIGMLNASLGRRAALARHAPPILFFRAQRANQGTDPPLAGGQVISVRNSQRGGNRCSPSPPRRQHRFERREIGVCPITKTPSNLASPPPWPDPWRRQESGSPCCRRPGSCRPSSTAARAPQGFRPGGGVLSIALPSSRSF